MPGYEAKILADSIADEVRLTTMQVTMPRIVLAEFNTHRMFSRNSASSRAIPIEKRIKSVREYPFIPEAFAANKKGMQAGEVLEDQQDAVNEWIFACEEACDRAERLAKIGVHKQWANRLIEPFSWQTVIVTATEWENFFALRISEHAQPEIRRAAELMKAAMDAHKPEPLEEGDWHLPLVNEEDYDQSCDNPTCKIDYYWLAKLSTARCARVSYLTHDGKRDPQADIDLHDQLLANGHMSPFEHVAVVDRFLTKPRHIKLLGTNLRAPWAQYRKLIPGEAVFKGTP